MYFEKSSTSAALAACPARLVPPPRARIGSRVLARDLERGGDIAGMTRSDHADRNLPVV